MKSPFFILQCSVVIALLGFGIFQLVKPGKGESHAEPEATGPRDHVELSVEKFKEAEITVNPVERRTMRPYRTVPGHLDYNATRHVQVKSPFDGLIRSIQVKVGDQVAEGQVIAVVDSPELGERRADVRLREAELQKTINEHAWWHSIQSNVDDLIAFLRRPQEMKDVEKEFADRPLGDFRQQIVAAYTRMRVDEENLLNSKSASESGGISAKDMRERVLARNTSNAKYTASCEQATFDVKQMHLAAETAKNDAEQRLAIARQRLGLLVSQPSESIPEVKNDASLSTWPVKAPFTATVEEVMLAPKERIQSGEGLFQLADTLRLWVQADIRERDWSALSISRGQTILVQTPAFPDKTFEATVEFVGRTVIPETRAVPITANIDNADGTLRPKMFVRVLIPDGEPRECLAIPQSAIATNDGRTFVFIETGPRQYHPRDVKTGLSVAPWIEIKSGLAPGDKVVTTGTAILKAELLLEAEE